MLLAWTVTNTTMLKARHWLCPAQRTNAASAAGAHVLSLATS